MRRISFLLIFTLLLGCTSALAKNKEKVYTEELNYEIEGAGTGNQGTYLVKVTVLSNKSKVDDELIARCAVHGVLFRGFSSKEHRQSHRPLAGSAVNEGQHVDFYTDFFAKGGPAKNYVSNVNSTRNVVKAGKEYKISTVVTVNKDQLARDLQNAGIIKGLNSGF